MAGRTLKVEIGSCSAQGMRPSMEDEHLCLPDLSEAFSGFLNPNSNEVESCFAVYDGHGGKKAATYARNHLHLNVIRNQHFRTDPQRALMEGYLQTDNEFMDRAMREGIECGTTAVFIMLRGRKLFSANAGDSRAVLCKNGRAVELTIDHKPDSAMERARIESAGGWVIGGAVNGCLGVSRALGDMDFKRNAADTFGRDFTGDLVTATPDVKEVMLTEEDEFIVLACDGLWDVMSSQEVCDLVRSKLSPPPNSSSPKQVAGERRGSVTQTQLSRALFAGLPAPNYPDNPAPGPFSSSSSPSASPSSSPTVSRPSVPSRSSGSDKPSPSSGKASPPNGKVSPTSSSPSRTSPTTVPLPAERAGRRKTPVHTLEDPPPYRPQPTGQGVLRSYASEPPSPFTEPLPVSKLSIVSSPLPPRGNPPASIRTNLITSSSPKAQPGHPPSPSTTGSGLTEGWGNSSGGRQVLAGRRLSSQQQHPNAVDDMEGASLPPSITSVGRGSSAGNSAGPSSHRENERVKEASVSLVQEALLKDTLDNVTVVLVRLRWR